MSKKTFLGLLIATSMLFASSCQRDEKTGKDYIAEIINNFNEGVKQDEILCSADDSRIYFKGVNSSEEAWADCATWIYSNDQGGEVTFVIPDNMGEVKAVEITDEEGAYIYVYFKLNNSEEVLLKYLHPNYINDDNVLIRQPWGPWGPGGPGGQTAL